MKHRHNWVISREVFWSDHGGDFRLMWCEVCKQEPPRGQFPIDLAAEAGEVTPSTPLRNPLQSQGSA